MWAGLRAGERSDLISQAPDKPGSNFSLFVIVSGALAGHIFMSGLLALQAGFCHWTGRCYQLAFDPNIYRVILGSGRTIGTPTDAAFFCWFISLLIPAVFVGLLAYRANGWRWVRDGRETATFGWLKRWVDMARPANSFIVAYVVTTLEHEGANVAYEGMVENIALDENRAIKMLVLSRCDRFLVRIGPENVQRIDGEHTPISLIQIEAGNFVNVALEIFQDDDSAVSEVADCNRPMDFTEA